MEGSYFGAYFISVRIGLTGGVGPNDPPVSGSLTFDIGGNTGTFTVTENIITGGTPDLGQPVHSYYWLSFPDITSTIEGTITGSFNRSFGLDFYVYSTLGGLFHVTQPNPNFALFGGLDDPNQTFPFVFTSNYN